MIIVKIYHPLYIKDMTKINKYKILIFLRNFLKIYKFSDLSVLPKTVIQKDNQSKNEFNVVLDLIKLEGEW